MDWKIAAAKQNFSQVVRKAVEEPQKIFNRDQLAAMVIAGPALQEFLDWKRLRAAPPPTGGDAPAAEASEIRQITRPYDSGYLRIRRDSHGHLPIPEFCFQKAGFNPEVEMQILARDGAIEITPAPRIVSLKRRGRLLVAFPVERSGHQMPQPTLTRDAVQETLNSIRRRDRV